MQSPYYSLIYVWFFIDWRPQRPSVKFKVDERRPFNTRRNGFLSIYNFFLFHQRFGSYIRILNSIVDYFLSFWSVLLSFLFATPPDLIERNSIIFHFKMSLLISVFFQLNYLYPPHSNLCVLMQYY